MEKNKYFQIITQADGDTADLLLYGFIGQRPYYEGDMTEPLTDTELEQKLNELCKKYRRVNIRINSPGGDRYNGDAMVNSIRRYANSCDIHTYNDGLAASMAATIWLAGPNRHMAGNAKLMIHATSSYVWGTAQDMRNEADLLDKMDAASAADISRLTGLSEEEVMQRFFDYNDHWYTYQEVKEMKLLSEDEEEYEGDDSMLAEAQKMTQTQLLKHFPAVQKAPEQSLLARIRQLIGPQQASSPQKTETVDKITIQAALQDGKLTADELAETLRSAGYQVAAPTKPEDKLVQEMRTLMQEQQAAFKQQLAEMQERIEQLGAAPGAAPIHAGAPPADPGQVPAEKAKAIEFHTQMAQIAVDGGNPFINAK